LIGGPYSVDASNSTPFAINFDYFCTAEEKLMLETSKQVDIIKTATNFSFELQYSMEAEISITEMQLESSDQT
jgi:hypothetical protein